MEVPRKLGDLDIADDSVYLGVCHKVADAEKKNSKLYCRRRQEKFELGSTDERPG